VSRKKNKTAIGSVLSQLKNTNLADASEVLPLKKKPNTNKTVNSFDFLNSNSMLRTNESVISIDPETCTLWKFKDRHTSDLGDIESLAKDINLNGQAQPGIVRKIQQKDNKNFQYEVIVGERRWRACTLLGIKFLVIVRSVDDKQASILQATENLHRKDLSDFSKGMNYHTLVKEGILTQSELQKKLGIPKATLSDLLSFAAIPSKLLAAIDNPSAITAKVASLIRANIKKGKKYEDAIISIANELSKGIGANKFHQLLNNQLSLGSKIEKLSKKIISKQKQHLFTVKSDGLSITGISFPKEVACKLNINRIADLIEEEIETQLGK
jgi:ParB family transcriptional regulator, chromosome partitioning protein